MPRKQGAGAVNAGAWRPRWPCCSMRLGLVCPFPCELGRHGMGRLAPACPLSARRGWRGQEGKGGRGRGRGRRALACPWSARTGWHALGKGGPGCGVPTHTGWPGASALMHPFRTKGKGKAGVACALGCPISAHMGGVAKRGGAGSDGDRGSRALVHPLPREWGKVGPGCVPSRAPIRAYGVARPKGGGEVLGATGRGGGRYALVHPPSARGAGLGVACPCVPPTRAYGAGRGGVGGDRESGQHALAHPPSARMGKGGGPGWAYPCVPPTRAYGVGRGGVRGDGESRQYALAHPLPREWGSEGPPVACPPMPPSRTYWGGAANGAGVGLGATGRGGRVPSVTPSARMGKGGVGRRAHARPFHTARTWGKGRGRGRGGDSMPSCAAFPRERGGADRGQGEGGTPSCAPPFYTRRSGSQCGGGEEEGWDLPSCAPFLRSNGAGRRSMRGKGKTREGKTDPARDEGKGRGVGRGFTLVRPLSVLERGGGQRKGRGRQGRG
ncbi:hypothetical protein EDB83DRAFT_2320065 [Lactarius deliciosus]|nr:hypothetical protein EDB83DRAFT_2320065 [Lactarius deliciosus]